jgi:hypothetical protein
MGQTMGQTTGQTMGQPMGQPMGQTMGQPMGQPMGTGAVPPVASGQPTGGLSMASPKPLAGTTPLAQPMSGTPSHLSQTGIQPMYQPSQAPMPMGQPVSPQVPNFGTPGAHMEQASQAHAGKMMGAPGQVSGMPPTTPRPIAQSTRLKPRSQAVKVTPVTPHSGSSKWIFLSLLVLAAAGTGAAYFLGYIPI